MERNPRKVKGEEESTFWRFQRRNWACVIGLDLGISFACFSSSAPPIFFYFFLLLASNLKPCSLFFRRRRQSILCFFPVKRYVVSLLFSSLLSHTVTHRHQFFFFQDLKFLISSFYFALPCFFKIFFSFSHVHHFKHHSNLY